MNCFCGVNSPALYRLSYRGKNRNIVANNFQVPPRDAYPARKTKNFFDVFDRAIVHGQKGLVMGEWGSQRLLALDVLSKECFDFQ
jgi:hypothetical protein